MANVLGPWLRDGILLPALREGFNALSRFATPECLTAAITVAGIATGGWGVAVATAVNVGVNAAVNDGGGAAKETLGASPEGIAWWLKRALQTQGAFGTVATPGGGQPIVTTVRNLKLGGNVAVGLISVYQCAESGS